MHAHRLPGAEGQPAPDKDNLTRPRRAQYRKTRGWIDRLQYGDEAQEARRAEGKDTGLVRLQDGQVTVVAELPKRIDWNQAMLAGLVDRIRADGADPAEYVDTAFSVPERKYTAWPKGIRKEFEPARTVRTGKPKFRLLLGEEVR